MLGNYRESIANFDISIDKFSKDFTVYNAKGVALAGLENFEQSIAYFDKALGINKYYTLAQKNKNILIDEIQSRQTTTPIS